MSPENPLSRLFHAGSPDAPDSSGPGAPLTVQLRPVLQRRTSQPALPTPMPSVADEALDVWPDSAAAESDPAQPRPAAPLSQVQPATREQRILERVRVERVIETPPSNAPEGGSPTITPQPVMPAAPMLEKHSSPAPQTARSERHELESPHPASEGPSRERQAQLTPTEQSQPMFPARAGVERSDKTNPTVPARADQQEPESPPKRQASPSATKVDLAPSRAEQKAARPAESKLVAAAPTEVPNEPNQRPSTPIPATVEPVKPAQPSAPVRVETRVEKASTARPGQMPAAPAIPTVKAPAAAQQRASAPSGVLVKIGRIEITARSKTAKPTPRVVRAAPRSHQVDPRLPFGRW